MRINIAKLRENGFNVDVMNDGYGGEPETINIYPGETIDMTVHHKITSLLDGPISEGEKEILVEQFMHKYVNRIIVSLCDE